MAVFLSLSFAQISACNASVVEDNGTIGFEDYTVFNLSSTGRSTQVASSDPAKLLAGRDLGLTGTANNLDSQTI